MDELIIEPIDLSRSRVFRPADLPVRKNPNGSESWSVVHGGLPTGEQISLHMSMQPAGQPDGQPAGAAPNPPHRIEHSEITCLREGTIEFQHDGITERAAAGDVLFIAKGTMHGVRNAGDSPAAYFVLAIGGDVNQQTK